MVLKNKNIIFKIRRSKVTDYVDLILSYSSALTYILGAQKNRLVETVLLSTDNICLQDDSFEYPQHMF